MDLADFRTLYDFNAWANNRTLEACGALAPEQFLRNMGSSFGSVRDTLAHIYGAEFVWFERWHERNPGGLPQASDFPDLETVCQRLTEMDRNLIDFVASLTAQDLQRRVQFKTMAGLEVNQQLAPCLQHVVNHGSYHRGQVTTLLRQLGAKAVSTDLIYYYREQAAQASA